MRQPRKMTSVSATCTGMMKNGGLYPTESRDQVYLACPAALVSTGSIRLG